MNEARQMRQEAHIAAAERHAKSDLASEQLRQRMLREAQLAAAEICRKAEADARETRKRAEAEAVAIRSRANVANAAPLHVNVAPALIAPASALPEAPTGAAPPAMLFGSPANVSS